MIIESEKYVCNLDLLLFVFDTAVFGLFSRCLKLSIFFLDLFKSLFKNIFELTSHELLEVGNERLTIVAVLFIDLYLFLEIFPHFWSDLNLHGVITWGDGLNVPLELRQLTVSLEVVKNSQVDEDEKDS